jgi:hypothetical protein
VYDHHYRLRVNYVPPQAVWSVSSRRQPESEANTGRGTHPQGPRPSSIRNTHPGVPGHQCTHPRNDQHCHDSATAARDKSTWKCYPASKILATKDPKVRRAADLAKERRERSSTEGTSCGRLRGKRITRGNDAGRAAIWACLGNGWTPEGVRIRAGSGNLGRWGKGRGVQRKFLARDLHF